ncbi:G2/mitotic-specific cyclin-4 [Zancudomyces culisetae]|uniref:G2/mitotic-specific cyclin-4 n=1 Tax=Zancudomyces culisetae TaxID=1213189 RepID=A0A1R1PDE8_ZANCU|nr:G2/mitotic-specific cyclin-4 [Zancudomyces culisetae]|eukprot:OMH78939.1 G2/mitotic-specific cyclin-4 [Zancudomyces culisetae]
MLFDRQAAATDENITHKAILTRAQAVKDLAKSNVPGVNENLKAVANKTRSSQVSNQLRTKSNSFNNGAELKQKPLQLDTKQTKIKAVTNTKQYRAVRAVRGGPGAGITRTGSEINTTAPRAGIVAAELKEKSVSDLHASHATRINDKKIVEVEISKVKESNATGFKPQARRNVSNIVQDIEIKTSTRTAVENRKIAKPASIYARRRVHLAQSVSSDGANASEDIIIEPSRQSTAIRRTHSDSHGAIVKAAEGTSSVFTRVREIEKRSVDDLRSMQEEYADIPEIPNEPESRSVKKSNSGRPENEEAKPIAEATCTKTVVESVMEVDEEQEKTRFSDYDDELQDRQLVVLESDDEFVQVIQGPKPASPQKNEDEEIIALNPLIQYTLKHTGLKNEKPITLEEIKAFESDVDEFDTTLVPAFADDIFMYMKELENKMLPDSDYMDHQTELTWGMRAILVDWLVQVHAKFRLANETLFLTINIMDRFLSTRAIPSEKVQLVGVVSLLIASKYEEIQVPSVSEIAYMTDNTYTNEEILKAERFILKILDFELGWPGPMSYLRRVSKADDYDIPIRTLSKYLLEVTLMEKHFIDVPCSKISALSYYIALKMLNRGSWGRMHAFYSGYFESELLPLVPKMVDMLLEPKSHSAIYDKYADRKYMRASEFVTQWFKKNKYRTLFEPTEKDLTQ